MGAPFHFNLRRYRRAVPKLKPDFAEPADPRRPNHASTRTTQLYDRRSDEVSLDEVERIPI
jgi:hypothetical protein